MAEVCSGMEVGHNRFLPTGSGAEPVSTLKKNNANTRRTPDEPCFRTAHALDWLAQPPIVKSSDFCSLPFLPPLISTFPINFGV